MPVRNEPKNDNSEESQLNESVNDDKTVCALTNKQYKNTSSKIFLKNYKTKAYSPKCLRAENL